MIETAEQIKRRGQVFLMRNESLKITLDCEEERVLVAKRLEIAQSMIDSLDPDTSEQGMKESTLYRRRLNHLRRKIRRLKTREEPSSTTKEG